MNVSAPTAIPSKKFSWSFSRLKNYETCPKRHFHVDIAKDFKEAEGEALIWGNEVHKALALRLGKQIPLPTPMIDMESWCAKIDTGIGTLLVEQKLAITQDHKPCGFFDGRAWFRAIGDVIKVHGARALILDWKTGKMLDDSQQLVLAAACLFAQYPNVQKVRSEFIWLKEGATTREDLTRADLPNIWANIAPRISQLEEAWQTQHYPPRPGYLCRRWCPVSSCQYHGK